MPYMKILNKYLEDWGKEEIDRLIEYKIPESKSIEYKRELDLEDLKKSNEKKEFLFDVAAFANAEGGVIFFGIDEELDGENTGFPTEVYPIEVSNDDKFKQRLEDIIGNNFDPSFSHYKIHLIPYEGKYIVALEIQKALGMPRMVKYKHTNKFYKRRSTGKYLVDTFELQNMFSEATQSRKAAEEWRKKRVREVRDKVFIKNLDIQGSLFLHILPIKSELEILDLTNQVKLWKLKNILENKFPSTDSGCGYNFEGYLIEDSYYRDVSKVLVENYFQLFRNGKIEFYSKRCQIGRMSQEYNQNYIDANLFEKDIIAYINIALKIIELYEFQYPFIIFVSIFDLMHIKIKHSNSNFGMNNQQINRNKLFLPPTIIYDRSIDIPLLMKPIFDIFWQAGGYARSGNFEDGKWKIAIH